MPEKPEWNIEDFSKEIELSSSSRHHEDYLRDIQDLLNLLNSAESQWASTFDQVKWLLEHRADATAAEVTLAQYGGMSSFNDFGLPPLNSEANKRLDELRNRIYRHATRARSDRDA